MTQHRQRALVLMEQGRPELAEGELRQALQHDPYDPVLHAWLSLCLHDLKRPAEALAEAREAVTLGPDLGLSHYALALALDGSGRADEAERAIGAALDLEPDDPDYLAVLAALHARRGRWDRALAAADAGLETDPEHAACANLRAQALVHLGRRDEASATLGAALSRDPENAHTHANQGWALLHRGEPRRALEHFREALRLNPHSEWARAGLVEAMKARNPVYAALLGYFLWMQRLPVGTRWIVILGGLFGFRLLSRVLRAQPGLEPVALAVAVVYLGFVLVSWTADQLFNLVLFLDPVGRHALSREQRIGAALLGVPLAAALGMAAAGFATGSDTLLVGAGLSAGLMVPLAGTLRAEGKGRLVLGVISACVAALLVAAGIAAWTSALGGMDTASGLVGVALLTIAASSWIGNFVTLRD